MKKIWIAIGIIAGIILIFGGTFVGYYNRFVQQEQAVDTQWAQVETQYQRRFDLVPNLVNATKGIMKQEREVFGKIAEARTRYAGARSTDARIGAANQLESALARLLVVMENYPQLRSADTVQQLMAQLEGTENRISVERRRYNEAAQSYNTALKRFPEMIFANLYGFKTKAYFKSVTEAQEAPKVEF